MQRIEFLILLACLICSCSCQNYDPKVSSYEEPGYKSSDPYSPSGSKTVFKSSYSDDRFDLDNELLNRAIKQATDTVKTLVKGTRSLAYYAKAILDPYKHAEAYKYAASHQALNKTQESAEFSLIAEKVSKMLVEYKKLSEYELKNVNLKGTYLKEGCPIDYYYECDPNDFRSLNGTCNNPENREWGSCNEPFTRLLDPDYADKISEPRDYGGFNRLPNPREVSETLRSILKNSDDVKHAYLSQAFNAFMYLLFRDVSHIPRAAGYHGAKIKCCNVSTEQKDYECFPALPSRADEYCMEYVRSSTAPNPHCTLGPRQQINQATAYIDASPIYGETEEKLAKIRRKVHGSNLTKAAIHHEPIPEDVAAIAKLFVSEHNRIAGYLKFINYNWDDERVFQEARRIVIAQIQHIAYNEFLPIVIGPKITQKFDIELRKDDYYDGYDSRMNPGVPNAVAVALNTATLLSKSDFAEIAKRDKSRMIQSMVKHKSRNNPFVTKKPKYMKRKQFDALALAIQQGRDHGLPGYQAWRKYCNLTSYNLNAELRHVLDRDVFVKLSKLYGRIEDVELIIAGFTEESEPGAVLGPTFSCICGVMFEKLRKGDRFWYENDLPPISFSKEQLKEIRKTSLAKLICTHSNSIGSLQPNVMVIPDYYRNAEISCKDPSMRSIDLEKWRDESYSDKVLNETLTELFDHVAKKTVHVYKDTKKGSSSGIRIHSSFLKASNAALHRNTQAQKLEEVTYELIKTHKDDEKHNFLKLLYKVDVTQFLHKITYPSDLTRCMLDEWKRDSPCDYTTPYRTSNGRCNNLKNPEHGMSLRPFQRWFPAQYDDYFKSPKIVCATGKYLPSARAVSVDIHHDNMKENHRYSLMLMQFGQIMDHDLGQAPVSSGTYQQTLDCSPCDSNVTVDDECFPIRIPDHDPFFPPKDLTHYDQDNCLPFTRSMAGQTKLGAREQINQVTSYLDLSPVYGSDECTAREIRSFRRGLLKVAPYSKRGREFLPRIDSAEDCRSTSGKCFLAGDLRCNEHPGLATLHTIFLRYHNNVVRTLAYYNRHWNDERLYQEGRRITTAIYQRIAYNEFLPVILGQKAMYKYGLDLNECHYYEGYNEYCDATVFNVFSTNAFRFGHSLVRPSLPRFGKGKGYTNKKPSLKLRDHFFNPDIILEEDMIDELTRGFFMEKSQEVDQSLSSEVLDHLFEENGVKFSGMDLAALNIQRGRDHGLKGYTAYHAEATKHKITNYHQLKKILPPKIVQKLEKLYKSVEDIDLYTGGLLEKHVKGGLVGPTFGHIIGKQFKALRDCDRYWYENDHKTTRFTKDQLTEIRKMTLAKIICDTTGIEEIQEYSLETYDDFRNPQLECKYIKGMDFSKWKDSDVCDVNGVYIPEGQCAPASPCTHCTCTSEGAECKSVRVKNCHYLFELYGFSAVKDDQVCAAQCPWPIYKKKERYGSRDGQYYKHDRKYSGGPDDKYYDDEYEDEYEDYYKGSLRVKYGRYDRQYSDGSNDYRQPEGKYGKYDYGSNKYGKSDSYYDEASDYRRGYDRQADKYSDEPKYNDRDYDRKTEYTDKSSGYDSGRKSEYSGYDRDYDGKSESSGYGRYDQGYGRQSDEYSKSRDYDREYSGKTRGYDSDYGGTSDKYSEKSSDYDNGYDRKPGYSDKSSGYDGYDRKSGYSDDKSSGYDGYDRKPGYSDKSSGYDGYDRKPGYSDDKSSGYDGYDRKPGYYDKSSGYDGYDRKPGYSDKSSGYDGYDRKPGYSDKSSGYDGYDRKPGYSDKSSGYDGYDRKLGYSDDKSSGYDSDYGRKSDKYSDKSSSKYSEGSSGYDLKSEKGAKEHSGYKSEEKNFDEHSYGSGQFVDKLGLKSGDYAESSKKNNEHADKSSKHADKSSGYDEKAEPHKSSGYVDDKSKGYSDGSNGYDRKSSKYTEESKSYDGGSKKFDEKSYGSNKYVEKSEGHADGPSAYPKSDSNYKYDGEKRYPENDRKVDDKYPASSSHRTSSYKEKEKYDVPSSKSSYDSKDSLLKTKRDPGYSEEPSEKWGR